MVNKPVLIEHTLTGKQYYLYSIVGTPGGIVGIAYPKDESKGNFVYITNMCEYRPKGKLNG